MKLSVKTKLLLPLVLALGLLGMALRVALYTTAVDERGLLASGHWATIALWAVTVLALAGLWALTHGITGPERYRDCYPQTLLPTLGSLACGLALGFTGARELITCSISMPTLASCLTLGGSVCLLAVAFCRLTGGKPYFLLHVVVCMAFSLRMICLYRAWSSDPQVMDYCFYMGAYIALMLTAYEHAAFDCGMGSHRRLWMCSLSALYLCLVSAWNSPTPLLLLAAALWCAGGLTSLKSPQRRVRRRMADGEEP